MSSRATLSSALLAGALLGALGACADSAPSAPVPTSISLGQTAITLDAIGATVQLGATVRDQNGLAMTGANVSWSSSAPGVATVSGTGLVTAVAGGTAQITATSGSASASATVTVAQAASAVEKLSGDAQSGTAGSTLPADLTVRVKDSRGNPVAGVSVAFAASSGGGTVDPVSATTNGDGQAGTTWTLPTQAGAHTVTATPASGSVSAQFTATALADVAHALAAISGSGQTGQVNSTLASPLIVVVEDQYGNAVAGQTVTFTPGASAGSVSPTSESTDASGEASTVWTLGAVSGTQTVEAISAGLQGSPVVFSANVTGPAAASIELYEGDGQTGLVGYATNRPPAVLIRDASGTPFPGASVTFAAQTGGGSVVDGVATSGADGIARPGAWILGAAAGANSLTATVTGTGITGNPVTFSATAAVQAFDIEIRFVFTPTAAQQAAFDAAEAYWERVIFGNLPQITNYSYGGGVCGGAEVPAFTETIDDLVIYAELVAIDGVGNILGQAGPCLLRGDGLLPFLGGMKFDTDDLAQLQADGQLDEVILHEVGHVLGYGTLWPADWLDLLADPSDPAGGGVVGADAHFTGEEALWAFDDVGGTTYTLGAKVPVENDNAHFDPGSLDSHWRESVFDNELMTPALNSGVGQVNPLSKVTAASMGDMGYTVNYAGTDTYALPGPSFLVAGPSRLIRLDGDVWRGPMHVVDAGGRTVRVIRWQ